MSTKDYIWIKAMFLFCKIYIFWQIYLASASGGLAIWSENCISANFHQI